MISYLNFQSLIKKIFRLNWNHWKKLVAVACVFLICFLGTQVVKECMGCLVWIMTKATRELLLHNFSHSDSICNIRAHERINVNPKWSGWIYPREQETRSKSVYFILTQNSWRGKQHTHHLQSFRRNTSNCELCYSH